MKMELSAIQFKKMEDPLGRSTKKKYICYVNVNDVPKDIPMATNPREQKLTKSVPKQIEDSLLSDDGEFHLKNRGIVISAKKVEYNTQTKKMTLLFDDFYEHGNIDGGHTYKVILQHQGKGLQQYVQFEIMVGVEDIIEPLAAARNTSTQVDEKSIAELEGKFAPIKDSIGGMPFYNRVAFKQNQHSDRRGVKVIDAREIVAIMTMFNIDGYGPDSHPTASYSSKAKVLTEYLKDQSEFEKMHNIAPDMFDLYSKIEMDFPFAYNATGGKYGAKKFSGYKEGNAVAKLKFGDEPLEYKVPDGLVYPILSAFRALVTLDEETNMYRWVKDPFDVYEEIRVQLASKIMKFTESIGNNPNAVGKDTNAWDMMYMTVERYVK
ncbi:MULTISPECIES: AIPR family protein [Bacillus cereus group]|uniref:AIPR family protein n=1 Tax=Bacillus cereus group TaxID=86661 RepID=UPI000BFBAAEF|nr:MULTISPECIES: AIPR family protein [Bacillus cereus group]KAB2396779.1 AIPR family protein [Bacillus cereus]PHF10040.1 abortive phage infection protein [Bacillus wiedmannii]